MVKRPKIRLSRLRDIGWLVWDPIGLLEEGTPWESVSFADEYDGYLLRAAGMIRRMEPKEDVIDYLVSSVTERMGMPSHPKVRNVAAEVVRMIESDDKLWKVDEWQSPLRNQKGNYEE